MCRRRGGCCWRGWRQERRSSWLGWNLVLLLLVETDVVHPHFACGGSGLVDCSGEACLAYGEVEDDIEGVIEDPFFAWR